MEEHLIAEPIETDVLRRLAKQTEQQEPVGRRLAAAIIAVPGAPVPDDPGSRMG